MAQPFAQWTRRRPSCRSLRVADGAWLGAGTDGVGASLALRVAVVTDASGSGSGVMGATPARAGAS